MAARPRVSVRRPAGRAQWVGVGRYWGHFLSYQPKIYLNNPEGRAFEVTVHVMQWALARWNRDAVKVMVTAPDGAVVVDGEHRLRGASCTLAVPAGRRGVYVVEPKGNVWLESSLDHALLWTGDP